ALPLGNGRLGAMVWGDPQRARFSLNESTLSSGTPARAGDRVVDEKTAAAAIARSRALFEQGEAAAAEQELAVLGGTWSQAFQPVGELTVQLPGTGDGAPCERALDLVHGEHRVEAPGGRHLTFTSAGDDVLVHAFPTAPEGVVTVDLTGPLVQEHRRSADGLLDVVLRAPSDVPPTHAPGDPGVQWGQEAMRVAVAVRWSVSRGRGLLVCAITTTWRGLGEAPDRPVPEVLDEAAGDAERALARGAEELRRRHHARQLPEIAVTDLHLDGGEDSALLGQVFALGRYLLAAASRPGLPPATLQGLWHQEVQAPWSSNFTTRSERALARGAEELPRRHHARQLPEIAGTDLHLDGGEDSALLGQVFALGRYLLAAASRPGLPPATLQGLWNQEVQAPWSSNFTT